MHNKIPSNLESSRQKHRLLQVRLIDLSIPRQIGAQTDLAIKHGLKEKSYALSTTSKINRQRNHSKSTSCEQSGALCPSKKISPSDMGLTKNPIRSPPPPDEEKPWLPPDEEKPWPPPAEDEKPSPPPPLRPPPPNEPPPMPTSSSTLSKRGRFTSAALKSRAAISCARCFAS
jgi:hypothetical protein